MVTAACMYLSDPNSLNNEQLWLLHDVVGFLFFFFVCFCFVFFLQHKQTVVNFGYETMQNLKGFFLKTANPYI